jgi:hypothetical protein
MAVATVTVAWLVNAISWVSMLFWLRQYAELRARFDVMTLTGAPKG